MRYSTNKRPTRLGLYTQKIVKPVFKARGLMEGKIITHWPQIVGENFAHISLAEKITFPPGKKAEGTLHLTVTSSGAVMVQYAQELILEQVNRFFGYKALTKLRMNQGLVYKGKKESRPVPSPLSEGEKEWLRAHLQKVEDPELKKRLETLGNWVCR